MGQVLARAGSAKFTALPNALRPRGVGHVYFLIQKRCARGVGPVDSVKKMRCARAAWATFIVRKKEKRCARGTGQSFFSKKKSAARAGWAKVLVQIGFAEMLVV